MKNLLQTELPKRFTDAVSKLYNAFHKGELNAIDECACAVGNICDNNSGWSSLIKTDVDTFLSPYKIRKRNIAVGFYNEVTKKTGYSVLELAEIERLFLFNIRKERGFETKESQFQGLCAVIEYLCELDNIPNVMDVKSLFEFEKDSPKRELSEVFI